jgi:hypothetical protein
MLLLALVGLLLLRLAHRALLALLSQLPPRSTRFSHAAPPSRAAPVGNADV